MERIRSAKTVIHKIATILNPAQFPTGCRVPSAVRAGPTARLSAYWPRAGERGVIGRYYSYIDHRRPRGPFPSIRDSFLMTLRRGYVPSLVYMYHSFSHLRHTARSTSATPRGVAHTHPTRDERTRSGLALPIPHSSSPPYLPKYLHHARCPRLWATGRFGAMRRPCSPGLATNRPISQR